MKLYCGSAWKPKTINRSIETIPTSTNVCKVATDCGIGFLKGLGRAGGQALACELVGTELAAWLGLPTLEFSIIDLNNNSSILLKELEIPFSSGPAFISKQLTGLITWDETEKMLEAVHNKSCITGIVIFDTWVMNFDRCGPQAGYHEVNLDNYAFAPCRRGKIELLAIDHTHIFAEGDLWEEIFDPNFSSTDEIYGLHHHFTPYMYYESAIPYLEKLNNIDENHILNIVKSVPSEWGNTPARTEKWVNCICDRARIVARTMPQRIFRQPDLLS
ncbi:HipA family kinase [Thalassospira sp.]|uniref:HipA family kinase n=1 Tax=Thalassospira sp. TaxID=1912094 RepID=UPI003AA818C4